MIAFTQSYFGLQSILLLIHTGMTVLTTRVSSTTRITRTCRCSNTWHCRASVGLPELDTGMMMVMPACSAPILPARTRIEGVYAGQTELCVSSQVRLSPLCHSHRNRSYQRGPWRGVETPLNIQMHYNVTANIVFYSCQYVKADYVFIKKEWVQRYQSIIMYDVNLCYMLTAP